MRVHQRVAHEGEHSGAIPSRRPVPRPVLISSLALKVTPFHAVWALALSPSWDHMGDSEHGGRERRMCEAPVYPA